MSHVSTNRQLYSIRADGGAAGNEFPIKQLLTMQDTMVDNYPTIVDEFMSNGLSHLIT